jgi:hypothetical protein
MPSLFKNDYFVFICIALVIGFGAGWIFKPVPEPVIEVQYLKVFPFVSVQVNGKKVDLTKIQIPLDNKKKGGDLPFAAVNYVPGCDCDPCDCSTCACAMAAGQRRDDKKPSNGTEFLGIGDLAQVLKEFKEAIFGTASKPGLRDDIKNGLTDWTNTLKVSVVAFVAGLFGLLGWIGLSLNKMANKA